MIVPYQNDIGRPVSFDHAPGRNLNEWRSIDGEAAMPLPLDSIDQANRLQLIPVVYSQQSYIPGGRAHIAEL